ncbi:MAG: hypothetical protein ACXAC5_11320 [Promethearchaeota archaeon]|jgi:hypothetical protein
MSKKKLIGLLSIFLVMGVAVTTINANAHRPMHLDFEYDTDIASPTYQDLVVTFIHGVTDRFIHYIEFIQIFVEGIQVHNQSYTSQPTTNIFHYMYAGIVANVNDNVTVKAWCSLEGITEMHIVWSYYEDKGTFASVIVPTIISTILVAVIVILPGIAQKLKNRK